MEKHPHPYREGQTLRIKNEFGETLEWTLAVINRTTGGNLRLTLRRSHQVDGSPLYANVYTGDPATRIEIIADPPEEERTAPTHAPAQESPPKRRPVSNEIFGMTWRQLESMQGIAPGGMAR